MTDVSAGTDLTGVLDSSGEYRLLDGTHTLSTSLNMADDIILTGTSGAVLSLGGGVLLRPGSNTQILDLSITGVNTNSAIRPLALSGREGQSNIVIKGCNIDTAFISLGQGFGNNWHTDIVIEKCLFTNSNGVFSETGERFTVRDNIFITNSDAKYNVRLWGAGHVVQGNYIDGGKTGVTFIANHSISGADDVVSTDNLVVGNTILNIAEEAISTDVVGNNGDQCAIRDYDTVSSTSGTDQVILSNAAWTGESALTGSKYYMIFLSGTLIGNYYLIETHSNATFTLDGIDADIGDVSASDKVAVGLIFKDSTIANNYIKSDKGLTTKGSGIILHGLGHNLTVVNNIVDCQGTEATTDLAETWAIRETNLNSVTSTDTVTGNARRCPTSGNTIRNNYWYRGGIGYELYHDYGVAADFTPASSTQTNNTADTDPKASDTGFLDGDSPCIGAGYKWWAADDRPKDSNGFPLPERADIGAVVFNSAGIKKAGAVFPGITQASCSVSKAIAL